MLRYAEVAALFAMIVTAEALVCLIAATVTFNLMNGVM